jgi:mono/diheme cytochrome c family protein
MRKAFKVGLYVIGTLIAIAALLALLAHVLSERKRQRTIEVPVDPLAFVSDDASIARGKHLFMSRGCAECHGENGGGHVVIDQSGMFIKSPNITRGSGSVVANYSEVDWVRTIRHGIKPDKHPMILMPSADYNQLTNVDLAALIAYTRILPPVAGEGAVIRLPLIVKALYAAGKIRDDAETIDHTRPPPNPVSDTVTPENGAYVANTCIGCHGAGLSGGEIPGALPEWPPAANLTPGSGSVLTRYDTPNKFVTMMRTGKRPDGTDVSRVMPFPSLKNLSDTELGALYAYLKTVPPRTAGSR